MQLKAQYTSGEVYKLALAELEAHGYKVIATDQGGADLKDDDVVFTFSIAPIEKAAPPQTPEVATPEPVKRKRKPVDPETAAARVAKMNAARKAKREAEEIPENDHIEEAAMEVVATASGPF